MSSTAACANKAQQNAGKRQLQRLRRDAGFTYARDFAKELGIPETTYSRYERAEEGPGTCIPVRSAWAIADALGCTIDLVVGREDIDAPDPAPVQRRYERLSKSDQQRVDEYLDFIEHTASEGRR